MILLGLGSNLGDRRQNLCQALRLLQAEGLAVTQVSALYETEPFGYREQGAFLNAVIAIADVQLSPLELLHICQRVERQLGRVRTIHWGPRVIDIDLLVFHAVEMATAELTLPHPYLTERRFVLVPIAELTDAVLVQGKSARELLASCADQGAVARWQMPAEWFCGVKTAEI